MVTTGVRMETTNDKACYVCVPFGSGPACADCQKLSSLERETKLTDTLLIEIEAEEKATQQERRN